MGNSTRWPTFQPPSTKLNETTISTGWNYTLLFVLYDIGGGYWQELPTRSKFTQTTRTYNTGNPPSTSIAELQGKYSNSWNTITRFTMLKGRKMHGQMHSLDNPITPKA